MTRRSRSATRLAIACMAALPLVPFAFAQRSNVAAAGSGPVVARYVVPARIDATGRTDDSVALQSFLDGFDTGKVD